MKKKVLTNWILIISSLGIVLSSCITLREGIIVDKKIEPAEFNQIKASLDKIKDPQIKTTYNDDRFTKAIAKEIISTEKPDLMMTVIRAKIRGSS